MKKNKFIPLAVLLGLAIVAFAMNNQQCIAEAKDCIAAPAYTKQTGCKSNQKKCGKKIKNSRKQKNRKQQ